MFPYNRHWHHRGRSLCLILCPCCGPWPSRPPPVSWHTGIRQASERELLAWYLPWSVGMTSQVILGVAPEHMVGATALQIASWGVSLGVTAVALRVVDAVVGAVPISLTLLMSISSLVGGTQTSCSHVAGAGCEASSSSAARACTYPPCCGH